MTTALFPKKNLHHLFFVWLQLGLWITSLTQAKLLRASHPGAEWFPWVENFSEVHQFGFGLGSINGRWTISGLAHEKTKTYPRSSKVLKLHYSYHISLSQKVWWFLGSSTGYEFQSKENDFNAAQVVHLPGLYSGVRLNFNPYFRQIFAVDIYLARIPKLVETDTLGEEKFLNLTLMSFADMILATDFVYSTHWSFRLEGHFRRLIYAKPKKSSNSIVGAMIKKEDHWLGLGIVYSLY